MKFNFKESKKSSEISPKEQVPFSKGKKEIYKPDFIPYACHFNPGTILTKNGELMNVIRVSGETTLFDNMPASKASMMDQEFRALLRQAINHAVKSDHYAIWIHTLRRPTSRSSARITSTGKNTVSLETDSVEEYVNDLYISILVEGQSFNLYDVAAFFRQLYYPAEFRYRMKYLENAERELAAVTKGILDVIAPYGAEQIGIIKEDGIYYSEILKFIGKIVNLKEEEWPVTPQDISEVIPSHKLTFGSNMLELKGETGRHFGVIYSIKEYIEMHEQHLDDLLRLPIEFIISESYDPMQENKYISEYKKIAEIQSLNETLPSSSVKTVSNSSMASTIKNMLGGHQITMMIIADNITELDNNCRQFVEKIEEFGLLIIREDVYMEDCYWSQLPGNFEFLKRLTPVETERVGGFAALHNIRRSAVSMLKLLKLKTNSGAEYNYELHPDKISHALIVGPPQSGKTTLMNMLIGSQDVVMPRLINFDKHRNSEIFFRSMDSDYYHIMPENSMNSVTPALNPLLLADTEENRLFLKLWLSELMICSYSNLPDSHKKRIDEFIEVIYSSRLEDRKINRLLPKVWKSFEEDQYTENLSKWANNNYYRSAFEFDTDIFNEGIENNLGLDLTSLHSDHFLHGPILFYLMHRVSGMLDGTPTLFVLENGLNLLNLPSLSGHISNWLTELSKKHTSAVITLEFNPNYTHPLLKIVSTLVSDKFFIAGSKFNSSSLNALNLDTQHITALESLSSKDRELLLVKTHEKEILQLHLSHNPLEYVILSSTHRSIILLYDAIRKAGPYANLWMPELEKHL